MPQFSEPLTGYGWWQQPSFSWFANKIQLEKIEQSTEKVTFSYREQNCGWCDIVTWDIISSLHFAYLQNSIIWNLLVTGITLSWTNQLIYKMELAGIQNRSSHIHQRTSLPLIHHQVHAVLVFKFNKSYCVRMMQRLYSRDVSNSLSKIQCKVSIHINWVVVIGNQLSTVNKCMLRLMVSAILRVIFLLFYSSPGLSPAFWKWFGHYI